MLDNVSDVLRFSVSKFKRKRRSLTEAGCCSDAASVCCGGLIQSEAPACVCVCVCVWTLALAALRLVGDFLVIRATAYNCSGHRGGRSDPERRCSSRHSDSSSQTRPVPACVCVCGGGCSSVTFNLVRITVHTHTHRGKHPNTKTQTAETITVKRWLRFRFQLFYVGCAKSAPASHVI